MARVVSVWLAIAWLTAFMFVGPVAAQRCDGVEIEVGAREQRCLKPGAGQSFKDCLECPEMVVIPAGRFTMGASPDEEVATEREDQVRVSIARPFAVGRFAVTRGEFAAFVAATDHKTDGRCYDLARCGREGKGRSRLALTGLSARRPPSGRLRRAGTMRKPTLRGFLPPRASDTGCCRRQSASTLPEPGSITPFWWGSDDFDGPSQLQWQRHVCRRRQGRVAQDDCSRRQFHRQSVGPLQRTWQRLGMDRGLLERKECRQPR